VNGAVALTGQARGFGRRAGLRAPTRITRPRHGGELRPDTKLLKNRSDVRAYCRFADEQPLTDLVSLEAVHHFRQYLCLTFGERRKRCQPTLAIESQLSTLDEEIESALGGHHSFISGGTPDLFYDNIEVFGLRDDAYNTCLDARPEPCNIVGSRQQHHSRTRGRKWSDEPTAITELAEVEVEQNYIWLAQLTLGSHRPRISQYDWKDVGTLGPESKLQALRNEGMIFHYGDA
jgi:hypothetical protein